MPSDTSTFLPDARFRLASDVRLSASNAATLLNESTGEIISSNGSSARLLQAIQSQPTYAELVAVLGSLTDAPAPDVVALELTSFLHQLLAKQLIEVVP